MALALLELFADVDTVLIQDDAFDKDKLNVGLRRIERAWVKARETLDPGFKAEKRERPQRWLAKTVKKARQSPAKGSPTSSSETTSTSATKRAAKKEKR